MKIAIMTDWLTTYAGAERCIESFINLYPNSELFTLVDFLDDKQFIQNKQIKTSFIQNLPFAKKYFRYYLPIFPYAIENFNFKKYNVILSSSHSVAKNILTNSQQLHICYCHTPMRYAWDLYFDYLEETNIFVKNFLKYLFHKIRIWDVIGANRVDYFIANSNFIKQRIKKIYNRDSIVIYPPVDIQKCEFSDKKENYYVTMSRLVKYKRIDLIIKAFNINKKKLVIIGDGPELNNLKKIANKNIEFTGFIEHPKAINIIKHAKAFVFAALEDFGIAPIEAQACGTPVIALGQGGTKETIMNYTGILFNNQHIDDINTAIYKFEHTEFDYYRIRQHSLLFKRSIFEEKIRDFVQTKYNLHKGIQ